MTTQQDPFKYIPQSPKPDSPPDTPPLDPYKPTKKRTADPSHHLDATHQHLHPSSSFYHVSNMDNTANMNRMDREISPESLGDESSDHFLTPSHSATESIVDVAVEGDDPDSSFHKQLREDEERQAFIRQERIWKEKQVIYNGQQTQVTPHTNTTFIHLHAEQSHPTAFTSSIAPPESKRSQSATARRNISPTMNTSFAFQQQQATQVQAYPSSSSSSYSSRHPYSAQHASSYPNHQTSGSTISDPSDMEARSFPLPSSSQLNHYSEARPRITSGPSQEKTYQLNNNHNHAGLHVNIPSNSYGPQEKGWTWGGKSVRSHSQEKLRYGMLSPIPKKKMTDSVGYWLALYFVFNLGLTLFNKYVLVSFPFPYTLTGLHALSGCIGTYIARQRGSFVPARLSQRDNLILAAFSVLYTINIAVSNISLQLVTVPFHQVVRASAPLFVIIISASILKTRFSWTKLSALLPVVIGVGFATYGDYYFTMLGLILTLLGTFLAALKTVTTNLIQTGGGGRLKLHPLDLLMRMSPLAFVQCVAYGWYTGELERVTAFGATQMTSGKAIALLINGMIAFGLNIVSFTANKKTGPLTMTVSANCKQVMTILLAVVLFDLHISFTNGIGIILTLVGGACYAVVEYREKSRRQDRLTR